MSRTRVRSRRLVGGGFRLLAGLFLLPAAIPSQAAVIHVSGSGSGADGSSWEAAYQSVSAGLAAAASGDEVWVVGGVYQEAIGLKEGVSLYGGFEGTEPANETGFNLRDWSAHETVIDAKGSGLRSVTAFRVEAGRVDGFSLTGGTEIVGIGSGILLEESSPTIANCRIHDNTGTTLGGGIYCLTQSDPTIVNCRIERNRLTGGRGGGLLAGEFSRPRILDSTISNNYAYYGGGLATFGDAVIFATRCSILHNKAGLGGGVSGVMEIHQSVIAHNTAEEFGGGAWLWNSDIYSTLDLPSRISDSMIVGNHAAREGGGIYGYEEAEIARCVITDNVASTGGGAAIGENSQLHRCTVMRNVAGFGGGVAVLFNTSLIHTNLITENQSLGSGGGVGIQADGQVRYCTIVGNTSSGEGGGINIRFTELYHPPVVDSCVIWENRAMRNSPGSNQISVSDHPERSVANSAIQGGWPGTGNTGEDPLFNDLAGGDFRLKYASPCIDAANETGFGVDLAGKSRPIDVPGLGRDGTGNEFDMGAYEFEGTTSPADLNGDGYVNAIDLLIFQNQWHH